MSKIGRNKPCPCGSGKKYKKCCLNRDDDSRASDPKNFTSTIKELKYDARIKQCLHPNQNECKGKIKGAHSIQNNKILVKIADRGEVYMPVSKSDNPFRPMTKWGRKKATVFTGFCDYHDTELFKPIENNNFNFSEEHIFLYIYRAFAFEFHKKQEAIKMQRAMYRKKPSLLKDRDARVHKLLQGFEAAVDDFMPEKNVFDKSIMTKDYNSLVSIVWKFDQEIKFAASGFEVLCYDLEGEEIQNINDLTQKAKHIFFSIFPEGEKSYFVIAWTKDNKEIFENYYSQLLNLSHQQRINFINNLLPITTENIVINPTAWKKLSNEEKGIFDKLFWGMADVYTAMSGKAYNMLEESGINLFDL